MSTRPAQPTLPIGVEVVLTSMERPIRAISSPRHLPRRDMICYQCGEEIGDQIGLCPECERTSVSAGRSPAGGVGKRRSVRPLFSPGTHEGILYSVWTRVTLGCLAVAMLFWMYGISLLPERRYPPGVLIHESPVQSSASGISPWQHKGYLVTPLARYRLKGRVVTFGRFFLMQGADLSPLDLTLTWGRLSDQSVLDHVQFTHAPRFVFLSYSGPAPIPHEEVSRSFSNNHLVPANDTIAARLSQIRKGDLVELVGYLVQISTDRFMWASSLTREDTGNGACELMWVDEVYFLNPSTGARSVQRLSS